MVSTVFITDFIYVRIHTNDLHVDYPMYPWCKMICIHVLQPANGTITEATQNHLYQ